MTVAVILGVLLVGIVLGNRTYEWVYGKLEEFRWWRARRRESVSVRMSRHTAEATWCVLHEHDGPIHARNSIREELDG